MVCPLRYIVAGVSIFVAFAVLLYTSSRNNADGSKKTSREFSKAQSRRTVLQRFVDLFTGRYLMDRWAEFKAMETTKSNCCGVSPCVSSAVVEVIAE